ncbi:MAG: ParB/RepB/Spo0J family partition protein [Treponema sp.]|jgi:ParB/RepB/Spo0J family partition protein|nr:ParB/RepB/Spo0J family partition protein [Treponema sp.]
MKTIELDKIISEDNRMYTKDEGFEQLMNSIKEFGIIEPPVVRAQEDGTYKIIAGRRRIAAVRKLTKGSKEMPKVNCVTVDKDDPRDDDDIALAENVNRQAMHPLDEAVLFFKMECRGLSVKEIAKLYARSPQDIYKRLRLMRLTDDLKTAFRDGKMDIEAAAIIAELPEEDQNYFYMEQDNIKWKYRDDFGDEDGVHRTSGQEAAEFVQRKQKFKIKKLIKGCADCKKRTHNTNNELFEDYDHFDDVCLDGDCYRKKWYNAIEKALNEQIKTDALPTDYKIYFASGIPAELYKKASFVEFNGTKCEVMKPNKYMFTHEETNRKKDACWRIREHGDGQITVERIGYMVKKKEAERGAKSEKKDDEVSIYCREVLEAVAEKRGVAAAELAKEINGRGFARNNEIKNNIDTRMTEHITARRIELDKNGATVDYFSLLVRALDILCSGWSGKLDKEQKEMLKKLTGCDELIKVGSVIPAEAVPVFHFVIWNILREWYDYEDIPALEELGKLKPGDNIYFDYSGMSKEEYKAAYMKIAEEATNEALNPKPKAELNKKEKAAKGKDKGVRKCRICGCTEDDCSQCIEKTGGPCEWVEKDLCSACVENK